MNKRNKSCIIYSSSKSDKLHISIKDKYFSGEIILSEEGLNQLKKLLNE